MKNVHSSLVMFLYQIISTCIFVLIKGYQNKFLMLIIPTSWASPSL